jgi:hypothetical protein
MSIAWWPALVFGWPGPILAVIFCVVGIVRTRVAWLIAAAVVIAPLSLYLAMNPRVQWGVALPLFPLIAAVAMLAAAVKLTVVAGQNLTVGGRS